jgi:hypothetical protein
MTPPHRILAPVLALALIGAGAQAVRANAYREQGRTVQVVDDALSVTPPRDWNRLSVKPGKFAETWTLDGEQLNDVTFYAGVASGEPIVRERNRKREPLPRFRASMLLVEVPELLEGTYRAYKKIGAFTLTGSQPARFLEAEGVRFAYEYLDADQLPRKGEAVAAIIDKRLYMVTFDAPRLHYHDRTIADYRALVATARRGAGAPTPSR